MDGDDFGREEVGFEGFGGELVGTHAKAVAVIARDVVSEFIYKIIEEGYIYMDFDIDIE